MTVSLIEVVRTVSLNLKNSHNTTVWYFFLILNCFFNYLITLVKQYSYEVGRFAAYKDQLVLSFLHALLTEDSRVGPVTYSSFAGLPP